MDAQSLARNAFDEGSVSASIESSAGNYCPSFSFENIDPGSVILNICCHYREDLIPRLTNFVGINGGVITDLQYYIDERDRELFIRIAWNLSSFRITASELHSGLSEIAETYRWRWNLHYSNHVPRMAVLVSREPHCLCEIISRIHSGEWTIEIPVIISNHPDLRWIAELNGINFHMIPITKHNKAHQEHVMRGLLKDYNVDFVVLARFMQILGSDFVDAYANKIINVHHSLLPAFPGRRPYHAAHVRGVKVVGATSHYVTQDLDAGPIIDQEVTRVSHDHSVHDLIQIGKDLERLVLAKAIMKHIQRKTMVANNRTVVFP